MFVDVELTLDSFVLFVFVSFRFGHCQVITAFVGNLLSKPEVVSWFFIYFMAVGLVIVLVFLRVRLLKIFLKFAGPVCPG